VYRTWNRHKADTRSKIPDFSVIEESTDRVVRCNANRQNVMTPLVPKKLCRIRKLVVLANKDRARVKMRIRWKASECSLSVDLAGCAVPESDAFHCLSPDDAKAEVERMWYCEENG
jgi:hypothetical protein